MDGSARLPIDRPRCENRGVVPLDDDRTIACPLCNNRCTLCLEGVPTFVPITRPYRGSLIAGIRPITDGETLFEGYACDYHKAALKSYSYIAPPMGAAIRRARHTSRHRGASLSCAMAMARQRTGNILRARPGRQSQPIGTRPMVLGSIPVQQSLLRSSYVEYETFTINVWADRAIRIERSRTVCSNGSLRRMAGGARARRWRVVSPSGSRPTRRRAAARG
jgi:hypothetical protein